MYERLGEARLGRLVRIGGCGLILAPRRNQADVARCRMGIRGLIRNFRTVMMGMIVICVIKGGMDISPTDGVLGSNDLIMGMANSERLTKKKGQGDKHAEEGGAPPGRRLRKDMRRRIHDVPVTQYHNIDKRTDRRPALSLFVRTVQIVKIDTELIDPVENFGPFHGQKHFALTRQHIGA